MATLLLTDKKLSLKSQKEKVREVNNLPPPPPKKKQRKTKYSAEWEKYLWLLSIRDDVYKANCNVCHRPFSISHGGVKDIKQHAAGVNHKKSKN